MNQMIAFRTQSSDEGLIEVLVRSTVRSIEVNCKLEKYKLYFKQTFVSIIV